jgi:hypothetical protein
VYVDWLRVVAVAGVFLVHVCEVFNPWDEWHITSPHPTRLAGEVALIMAPWIMPLFMLLAGVSAWYALEHRTNAGYVRERVLRVLLPLVVGTLVLVPPQVYLERRLNGQFSGSFWSFYPHFFQGIYPKGNFSWHHLWFLAHLFVYSLLALPLFRYWRSERGGASLRWIAQRFSARGGVIWLALPLILERSLLWGLFPERHMLTTDWANHSLLFVAYVYGFILAATPQLGQAIDKQWPVAANAAVLSTIALSIGAWTDLIPDRLPDPYAKGHVAFWVLYALCAWAWMVATLGVARRWLRDETVLLRYGRAIGYEWYLVHQPVIVALAYLIVQSRMAVGAQFSVLLLASFVLTWIGAELVRRLLAVARLRSAL